MRLLALFILQRPLHVLFCLFLSFLAWFFFPLPPQGPALSGPASPTLDSWKGGYMKPSPAAGFPFFVKKRNTSTDEAEPPIKRSSATLEPSPLGWLLGPKDKQSQIQRILADRARAEAHEPDPHFRDDIRQSWILIFLAGIKGLPAKVAEVCACYAVYGVHPDRVWEKFLADRKSKLGPEYERWFDSAGNLRTDVPKKPSLAEVLPRKKEGAL